MGGCFAKLEGRRDASGENQEGGSVPHPSLDAASSAKVSSPDPESPSPVQPQIDSTRMPSWPKAQQL